MTAMAEMRAICRSIAVAFSEGSAFAKPENDFRARNRIPDSNSKDDPKCRRYFPPLAI
jgi:hypothetical protein